MGPAAQPEPIPIMAQPSKATASGAMANADIEAWLGELKGRHVVVVGDVALDRYVVGRTSRISREAPVLILKYSEEFGVPGQAANTACNVARLGGRVSLCSVCGRDEGAAALVSILARNGVTTSGVVQVPRLRTLTKTRILAGGHHTSRQQVIRIDDDDGCEVADAVRTRVETAALKALRTAEALVVCDYGYGLVTQSLWVRLRDAARKRNVPVILDSRRRIAELEGATLITPNEEEAYAACNAVPNGAVTANAVGTRLLKKSGAQSALVTRGNEGMMLFQRGAKATGISIFGGDEVTDVTGAGDTVVAAASLALAAGRDVEESVRFANVAAGIVVMKTGTATVSLDEIRRSLRAGRPVVAEGRRRSGAGRK